MDSFIAKFIGCMYLLHQTWLESRDRPHSGQPSFQCQPDILPRKVIFGTPELSGATLSFDGKYLAYVKPWNGTRNLYIQRLDDAMTEGRRITAESGGRGVTAFHWTYQPDILLYPIDKGGNEMWQLMRVDVAKGKAEPVTPQGYRASVAKVSAKFPHRVVLAVAEKSAAFKNLYYLDLKTGKQTLLFENTPNLAFANFIIDNNLRLRLASKQNVDGGDVYFVPVYQGYIIVDWRMYKVIPVEESQFTKIMGIADYDDSLVIWQDAIGKNLPDLRVKPIINPNLEGVLVYQPIKAEISSFFWPRGLSWPIFVTEDYGRPQHFLLNNTYRRQFEFLNRKAETQEADWMVVDYSDDLKTWLVGYNYDNAGPSMYAFDAEKLTLRLLYVLRDGLQPYMLSKMRIVEVPLSDDLTEVCYLSIPRWADLMSNGQPNQPLAMVVTVHGGPWGRSSWGFNTNTQWLTNRGYAVLDCNFRASVGYGKKHFNLGVGEWGRKMQEDIIKAVDWAIERGVADPERIAISGASYGGYAALSGLTFTPDKFACAIDVVGPSNLVTLVKSIPPFWEPFLNRMLHLMGGDPRTRQGMEFLRSRSPINFVNRIKKPLLVAQGKNDPRVNKNESEQIVNALKAANIPVTYVFFPDEGHSFQREENKLAFAAVMEQFLGSCLGGRYEPIGDVLANSSAQIREVGDLHLPKYSQPST